MLGWELKDTNDAYKEALYGATRPFDYSTFDPYPLASNLQKDFLDHNSDNDLYYQYDSKNFYNSAVFFDTVNHKAYATLLFDNGQSAIERYYSDNGTTFRHWSYSEANGTSSGGSEDCYIGASMSKTLYSGSTYVYYNYVSSNISSVRSDLPVFTDLQEYYNYITNTYTPTPTHSFLIAHFNGDYNRNNAYYYGCFHSVPAFSLTPATDVDPLMYNTDPNVYQTWQGNRYYNSAIFKLNDNYYVTLITGNDDDYWVYYYGNSPSSYASYGHINVRELDGYICSEKLYAASGSFFESDLPIFTDYQEYLDYISDPFVYPWLWYNSDARSTFDSFYDSSTTTAAVPLEESPVPLMTKNTEFGRIQRSAIYVKDGSSGANYEFEAVLIFEDSQLPLNELSLELYYVFNEDLKSLVLDNENGYHAMYVRVGYNLSGGSDTAKGIWSLNYTQTCMNYLSNGSSLCTPPIPIFTDRDEFLDYVRVVSRPTVYGAGGGGSGYIGNNETLNKTMVGFHVPTASAAGIKTRTTTRHSPTPISGYAKEGNGAVKITYLGPSIPISAHDFFMPDLSIDGRDTVRYDPDSIATLYEGAGGSYLDECGTGVCYRYMSEDYVTISNDMIHIAFDGSSNDMAHLTWGYSNEYAPEQIINANSIVKVGATLTGKDFALRFALMKNVYIDGEYQYEYDPCDFEMCGDSNASSSYAYLEYYTEDDYGYTSLEDYDTQMPVEEYNNTNVEYWIYVVNGSISKIEYYYDDVLYNTFDNIDSNYMFPNTTAPNGLFIDQIFMRVYDRGESAHNVEISNIHITCT